jgi:single-strand DNA-binding protein
MSTQITILGNTGRDVELRYTPQGTAVANFSVASNTVRNSAEGQKKKTDWFNVSAFGRQAETLAKYLTKGSMILVRGKLTFNPWLSRDGEARVSADIVLQDFEFAGASPSRATSDLASEAVSTQQEAGSEIASPQAGVEAEEKAEMMAVLEEMSSSDEPFAGQF